VNCPNCGFDLNRFGGPAHRNGCVLGGMLTVLEDRGHELDPEHVQRIDVDAFWESFGGPGADFCAAQMGLPAYPKEDA